MQKHIINFDVWHLFAVSKQQKIGNIAVLKQQFIYCLKLKFAIFDNRKKEKIMHEVVVKYKNRKMLKVLTALGEYLGLTITDPERKEKKEVYHINGIPVESGDSKIDMQELTTIFTGEDINTKTLRESAWQRKR